MPVGVASLFQMLQADGRAPACLPAAPSLSVPLSAEEGGLWHCRRLRNAKGCPWFSMGIRSFVRPSVQFCCDTAAAYWPELMVGSAIGGAAAGASARETKGRAQLSSMMPAII